MSNHPKHFHEDNLTSAGRRGFDALQQLNHWLGLDDVAQRRWFARLPAVVVAALILAMFVWTADLGKADLSLVLALGLLVGALGLQTGVK